MTVSNLVDVSSSISTRLTTEEGNVDDLETDSGSFSTRVTDLNLSLSGSTSLISGSAVSTGSFGSVVAGGTGINTLAGALSAKGGAVFNEDSADVDFRVESNGNANMLVVDGGEDMVFVGTANKISFDAFSSEIMMQLEAVGTAPYAGLGMVQNSNDTDSSVLIFGKSRGTSAASTTIVQDGDLIGRIEFQGMDGSDLETGASIVGEVDGTPGDNDMPGRLVFKTTADGADSATARMTIKSDGKVGIGTSAPIGGGLDILGDEEALVVRTGDSGRVGIVLKNTGTGTDVNFTDGLIMKLDSDESGFVGLAASNPTQVLNLGAAGNNILQLSGSGRVTVREGLLEVGEHGVAGAQIVSDGGMAFHAGFNDSSTGNGDFTFKRYGESTTANTMATIFSTGNAFFGDSQTQANSSHFQYASTFGDNSYARVGFFNNATGNDSGRGLALQLGQIAGTSHYLADETELAIITFLGQANDAAYVGGSIAVKATTGGNIGRAATGCDMMFSTIDTSGAGAEERMRITSEGNVGIGTTAPTAFYPCFQVEGTQPAVIINDNNSDAFWTFIADEGNSILYFDHSGAVRFITATNNGGSSGTVRFEFNNDGTAEKSSGAGDWASTSDVRLKKNVEDLNIDALNVLNTLRPVEFNWKNEELHNNPKDSNGKSYGFLADEIETVMPQLVTTSEIVSGSADTEYLDEDKMAKKTELGLMASLYIKAIQQLSEKNEALEKRIEELEN
jgi:hypothetical protein